MHVAQRFERLLDAHRRPDGSRFYDEETGERVGTTTTQPPGKFAPELVVPGMHRKRTPEEMEQLRQEAERERAERYRSMYAKLGLKAVIHKVGTLEFTWKAGKAVSKLCDSPRWRAAATIFSSSTPRRSKE